MAIFSVVIPFLNEESCITDVCEFYDNYAENKPYKMELIFVDDGSTDKSVEKIENYQFKHCEFVKVVLFSRNFGSHAAIRAGVKHSIGDFCIFVCADLQEPDDLIDTSFNILSQEHDLVFFTRGNIDVGFLTKVFSNMYSLLMRTFVVKSYYAITNFAFNRKLIDYLNENIENNSSIGLQLTNIGFKTITISKDYKARAAGVSKWTFSKKIKLLIDSFVAFSYLPIRAVSVVGILMFLVGFVYGVFVVINSITNPDTPAGFPTLVSILVMGFGVTNISLGIIAEYLWRTFDVARRRPVFTVTEIKKLKTRHCSDLTDKTATT